MKLNNRVILENNRGRGSRGPPGPPVGPGGRLASRGSRGTCPPGQKQICVFSDALGKLFMNLRLFIFIIQKSCQILEIIHFSNKNKKKKFTKLQ